jgi:hypothetical protein
MPKGCFMVRAVLAEAEDRPRFDRWYQMEHLPQALVAFGAQRAWRSWSRTSPGVHYAFYEFTSVAAAEALTGSAGLAAMVAEFDRVWGGRVGRSREVLELAD